VVGYALPGTSVFPEGITGGPGTTFFVGSMADGGIYRGDTATGRIEMFVPPDGDGRTTITGLAVDGYGRLIACDYDGGQLFVYDLAARSLVARRVLPAEESWPNDVAVAGDSAYVTDTKHPLVWRLPAGRGGVGDPSWPWTSAGSGLLIPPTSTASWPARTIPCCLLHPRARAARCGESTWPGAARSRFGVP